jgi:hypothetical protein
VQQFIKIELPNYGDAIIKNCCDLGEFVVFVHNFPCLKFVKLARIRLLDFSSSNLL